jgi:hypothetical protein
VYAAAVARTEASMSSRSTVLRISAIAANASGSFLLRIALGSSISISTDDTNSPD